MIKLYDYFRSTASYRVRIALAIKQLSYEKVEVHLVNQGGEQHHPDYQQINPQQLVPTLIHNGHTITQSLAIIDYLESCYPEPALLPQSPDAKATVHSLALSIACDIHPLNNLRVLQFLVNELQVDDVEKLHWYHHWIRIGFNAIEQQLAKLERQQAVCYGDNVTLADICLIPQVYNAKRFKFALDDYPLISQINDYCLSLEAFDQAKP